jgi:hypothetical protein
MPRLIAFLACLLAAGPLGSRPPEEQELPLEPLALTGDVDGITLLSAAQTPAMPGRILDVSLLAEDRLAVLSEEAMSLYRRDGQALKREGHLVHSGPLLAVRAPAGCIRAVESERAVWVAANHLPGARLFTWEGSRLAETQQADALPGGLRYRPGTNLLELGEAQVVRVRQGLAVSGDGRLGILDGGAPAWTAVRVGDAVARPWPRIAAASSTRPPGGADALGFYDLGPEPRLRGALGLEGSVKALASRRLGGDATVVLAIAAEGGDRLVFLRLGRENR